MKKNDPLARIDVSETGALVNKAGAAVESAKAGYLQAQVVAQRAEREKARMQKLREFGLATQQNYEDAESEATAANAGVEAARAQIRAAEGELRSLQARLSRGLILSPMDGIVSLRDVNVGDLASDTSAAKALFKIVDNRIPQTYRHGPVGRYGFHKGGGPSDFYGGRASRQRIFRVR